MRGTHKTKNYFSPMSIKKILTPLFLISATLAYPAGSQEAPQNQKEEVSASKSEATPAAPALETTHPEAPTPLPSSEDMTSSYESAFIRMLVTLLGLVFLVFATFWVLRRMGGGKFKMGSSKTINIIEKRALSPKSMLYIVEIENKRVLISESQVEVRALTPLGSEAEE